MPLHEYHCQGCKHQFEEIRSSSSSAEIVCPQCKSKRVEKLVSRFAVAGRGDLRESTLHGCHEAHVPPAGDKRDGGSHEGHSH